MNSQNRNTKKGYSFHENTNKTNDIIKQNNDEPTMAGYKKKNYEQAFQLLNYEKNNSANPNFPAKQPPTYIQTHSSPIKIMEDHKNFKILQEKLKQNPGFKDKSAASEEINKKSVKDILAMIGYFELLDHLKAQVKDNKESECLKDENLNLNNIIVQYNKKLEELKERNGELENTNKELEKKISDMKFTERKLNNDLMREKSKSPFRGKK